MRGYAGPCLFLRWRRDMPTRGRNWGWPHHLGVVLDCPLRSDAPKKPADRLPQDPAAKRPGAGTPSHRRKRPGGETKLGARSLRTRGGVRPNLRLAGPPASAFETSNPASPLAVTDSLPDSTSQRGDADHFAGEIKRKVLGSPSIRKNKSFFQLKFQGRRHPNAMRIIWGGPSEQFPRKQSVVDPCNGRGPKTFRSGRTYR